MSNWIEATPNTIGIPNIGPISLSKYTHEIAN